MPILTTTGIERNFRFLALEVAKQVDSTLRLLGEPSESLREKIRVSDDYVDTLKALIEEKCYSALRTLPPENRADGNLLRAVNVIANNLERIADFSVSIVLQTGHLSDGAFIHRYDYPAFFAEVTLGLELVVDGALQRDTTRALRLCKAEFNLDELYKHHFARILKELKAGGQPGDSLTSLLILHYLERMGDSLQNIGEAIIFASTGERLKVHQYQSLRQTAAAGMKQPSADLVFESIWGTRSGMRIGRIHDTKEPGPAHDAIYKEGNPAKLRKEKENIERWAAIRPGLAPLVLEYQTGEQSSTMLLQYLGGRTLQDIVVNGDPGEVTLALGVLAGTVREVWEATMRREPVNGGYVDQLGNRLADIYKVHPEFRDAGGRLGGLPLPSLPDLLERVRPVAAKVDAPFRVFIHGDFNIDNVLVELPAAPPADGRPRPPRLHYIDLHRSAEQDYVQDVSVFMVSNFRLPLFEERDRRRLETAIDAMLAFGRRFAQLHADRTFEYRVALGLVRSLVTSTRFEFHGEFARAMFLRAVYLLERLLAARDPAAFRLPEDILRL